MRAARLPVFEASDRPGLPASKPMAGALDGVVIGRRASVLEGFADELVTAIAAHRHYERPVDGIAA